MNDLKRKILNCEKVCGTHVSMSDFMSADILGSLGYDFIWVDTEHSCIDYKSLLSHITAIKNAGGRVIVRLHQDDFNHTKRVLEMGVDGVIFPMINTREEAEKAIASTYYPPRGNRGFGPLRAAKYGNIGSADYLNVQDELVRCVQIESPQAIENLEEIVRVEGIDCFIFGPCDLCLRIGEGTDVLGDKNISYIKRAIDVLKKHGKSIGVSTGSVDEEVIRFWDNLGVNFISSGTDYDYIRLYAGENLERLRRVQGEKK